MLECLNVVIISTLLSIFDCLLSTGNLEILLLVCKKNSGFRLSVWFQVSAGFCFGYEFVPETEFGSGSGFKFGFWFWVPRHSTRTVAILILGSSRKRSGFWRPGLKLWSRTILLSKRRPPSCGRRRRPSPRRRNLFFSFFDACIFRVTSLVFIFALL